MEEDVIQVRYIGREPMAESYGPMQRDRDRYHRTVGLGDFYEMDLNIDGKEVTAVLIVNEEVSVKRDMNWGKRNPMIGLYEFTDPTKKEEWYEEFKSSLETETEVGKEGEELTLDMRKSTINIDMPKVYVEEYRKMYKKIIDRLYEIKKSILINGRKKSFDEEIKKYEDKYPEIKLDNIMANLSEEEAKKAKELHDKMVECVLVAKYGWNDYLLFMENLPEIVRKEKAYIANSTINALRKSKENVYTPLSYSPYYVAGFIEERAYSNIRYSGDELLCIDIAPIKEKFKEKIDESGIKVLGTLSDDRYDKGYRIHADIFSGENFKESRGFVLIYEDADGNLRFRKEVKEIGMRGEVAIEEVSDRVKNVSIEDKDIAARQLQELNQDKEVKR